MIHAKSQKKKGQDNIYIYIFFLNSGQEKAQKIKSISD